MGDWKAHPLGICLVDRARPDEIAIHHVSVHAELGITFAGCWVLEAPTKAELDARLTHWTVIGTTAGIRAVRDVSGPALTAAKLADLSKFCAAAEADLDRQWHEYRDLEPKKREKIKPLNGTSWLTISDDNDAATIVGPDGRKPVTVAVPDDLGPLFALAHCSRSLLTGWYDLESERLSRPYLAGEHAVRRLYPPEWLRTTVVYWPVGGSS